MSDLELCSCTCVEYVLVSEDLELVFQTPCWF